MHPKFRHAYLQYIGVRVGGRAIAVDYQLTVYWGEVIAISATGYVTLKYYAGETKGYKTLQFHPYRCYGNPYDEKQPPNGHLQTRYSVLEHFHQYVIPNLKAFPEYYAEIERLNSIVYCQHCRYDEEFCNCLRCEDCGRIYPDECGCEETVDDADDSHLRAEYYAQSESDPDIQWVPEFTDDGDDDWDNYP